MFCYQKNFSNPTLPVDEAQFYALVRATQWNENIDKFRETHDAALKRKLPAFIFQATFDETTSKSGKTGAWRKQSATRLTGLVVMDIDHVDDPLGLVNEKLEMRTRASLACLSKNEKWAALGVLLVYITPSGQGLKIVFKARTEWGNLIDNQHQMAKLLGVEVDESCKDASRMSFICKESDILFIDKELFTYENKEFAERYTALYRDGHSQAERTMDEVRGKTEEGDAVRVNPCPSVPKFKNIPYSEIIDAWWERNGGVPQEGERNVKLYQLAVSLRAICDNNKALLLEIMPRLGLDEQELHAIVESACKEPPKGLSKTMLGILSEKGIGNSEEVVDVSRQTQMEHRLLEWGHQIGELFDDFPMLKDVCGDLPVMQRPAAVFLAGGFMMTLMTRCWYRFYHKPQLKRRLNCSLMVIGDPASGKSVAGELYDLLCAPIKAFDKKGKNAVNSWKETTEAASQNKDKDVKPHAQIRIHPARTSNQTFITDMVNTKEVIDGEEVQLHMLTFDSELDNTLTLQSGGSWINKLAMELKAFHNEEDGQAYSNKGSIQDDFNVTWNYIYTGTPIAMKSKVNNKNFGTGLPTRLTCIPIPATNFKMMKLEDFEHYDFERDERMRKWASLLDQTKGELKLWPLVKNLWEWTNRRMMDACEDDSKAEEMLCKRCAYHGLNYSAPYIVMRHWDQMHQDGTYWCGDISVDDKDWKLCELLTNIHHACQIHYFLGMAENYFDNQLAEAASTKTHRLKTVEGFNKLPKEFTVEDVMRCFNLKWEAARTKVKRLMSDHIVEKTGEYVENGTTKAKYTKIGILL